MTGINRHEMTWSHRTTFIVGNKAKAIKRYETERTDGNRRLKVGKDLHHVVKGKKRELVQEDVHLHVKGKRNERIDGTQSLTLLHDQFEFVEGSHALTTGGDIHFAALEKMIGEASDITFKGPGGFIRINGAGVTISGTIVEINVGGSSGQGKGSKPKLPELPDEARVPIPTQPDGKEEQQFQSERQNLGVNALSRGKGKKKGPGAIEAPPLSRIYKTAPSAADLVTDPRVDHDLKQAWGESRPTYSTGVKTKEGKVHEHGGPIPTGRYRILPPSRHPHLGLSCRLDPYDAEQTRHMAGRDGFYIHGRGPHGSDGCIVPLEDFQALMTALEKDRGGVLFVLETMDGSRFA